MLKGKTLLDYTNLFSTNDYHKNDKIILKNIKTLWKTLALFIICSKCKNKDEKIFKEDESIKILKILGLIENI